MNATSTATYATTMHIVLIILVHTTVNVLLDLLLMGDYAKVKYRLVV